MYASYYSNYSDSEESCCWLSSSSSESSDGSDDVPSPSGCITPEKVFLEQNPQLHGVLPGVATIEYRASYHRETNVFAKKEIAMLVCQTYCSDGTFVGTLPGAPIPLPPLESKAVRHEEERFRWRAPPPALLEACSPEERRRYLGINSPVSPRSPVPRISRISRRRRCAENSSSQLGLAPSAELLPLPKFSGHGGDFMMIADTSSFVSVEQS